MKKEEDDIFDSLELDNAPAQAEPQNAADDIFESFSIEGASGEKNQDAAINAAKLRHQETDAPADPRPVLPIKELNTAGTVLDRNKVSQEKEKKKKSGIKKIILCVILEALTLCAIFGYAYLKRSWDSISRPKVDISVIENQNISMEKKKEMQEGYWTVAVFGVDGRSSEEVVGRGLNSDVIIICNIDLDSGDIKLCSVFRDTYLNVSDKNTYNKINQAYALGGPEQALAALNKNLDLNITNYVAFNWKAVVDGINILGGVDNIPISNAEFYYINAYITETVKVTKIGSVQLKQPGVHHLDGVQAVAYARLRNMDNDFARTERQKNIIKACFEKAKQADFAVLNHLMVTCFPQVATNIGMGDVVKLAQNITKYNIAGTGGFPWSRGDANVGSRGSCVIPTTLESNVRMLHEFLYNDSDYTPSDAVMKYSQKIKEDSHLYKEGTIVESVRTDLGMIPKANSGKSSDTDEKYTTATDDNGDIIYPTDSEGNIIQPRNRPTETARPEEEETDEFGNVMKYTPDGETDADELPQDGPGGRKNINPTADAGGSGISSVPLDPSDRDEEDGDEDEDGGPGVPAGADEHSSDGPGPGGSGGRQTDADRRNGDREQRPGADPGKRFEGSRVSEQGPSGSRSEGNIPEGNMPGTPDERGTVPGRNADVPEGGPDAAPDNGNGPESSLHNEMPGGPEARGNGEIPPTMPGGPAEPGSPSSDVGPSSGPSSGNVPGGDVPGGPGA